MRGARAGAGGTGCRAGENSSQGEFPLPAAIGAWTPVSGRWDVGTVFMFPGTLFPYAGTNCLENGISDYRACWKRAGVKRQTPEFLWDDGVVVFGCAERGRNSER